MYKYFISYSYMNDGNTGFGNAIIESKVKITYFKSLDGIQTWIDEVQRYIEEKDDHLKNVFILNFILLN